MFEDFINALRNFKSNKARTILSLLGIIIAVASVIMVTTIGESAVADVKNSLGSTGLDLVEVRVGWSRSGPSSISFNEAFRKELAASVEGIKDIVYTNEFNGTLQYGALHLDLSLMAVEQEYFAMKSFTLNYGRFFSSSEQAQGIHKIILGSESARYLFPGGQALGKIVTLLVGSYWMGFEVIGVLEKTDTMAFNSPDQAAMVPRSVYTRKINPADTNAGSVLVQARDQNNAPRIQKSIERFGLEKSGGNEQALYVFSMQSVLEQYNQITRSMNLLLSGIAGISLLVGGIGIMNIMIVTVTERKREIGIRKALGASPAAIRLQFLTESAAITLFGGIIGIILGLILSFLVILTFNWTFAIHWGNCLIAFIFSAVVGIFFGLHPAIRAAKLDPVEALAGE
ncbi:MAG: ABC transporter permease [Treponema sp.]|nr:ABC transporter permease [Treponema sp.]